MDALLKILRKKAKMSHAEIAQQLNISEQEVADTIHRLEQDGTILGYQTIVNRERCEPDLVTAAIEVSITPEREGGFERVAKRIARFDEVESVYLMSGGYDLLVIVDEHSLRDVAAFVTNKLSAIDAVQSCVTRFRLKTYKENSVFYTEEEGSERLSITP